MTRKNLIALLEAKRELAHTMADYWKRENDLEEARRSLAEASAYLDCIYCLQDDDYAQRSAEINHLNK